MIRSDNLANDLHWGGRHIKLNELHRSTLFQCHPLSFFFSYSLLLAPIYAESEMYSTLEDMQYSLL